MNVLGIGGSAHDFSTCVAVDGVVVSAIEEERLSRVRYHPLGRITPAQLRLRGVEYCLEHAGLGLDDIDVVVANDLVFAGMLRGLGSPMLINHHLSHAASSFYISSFSDAAVLVMDGFGSMQGGRAETVSYFQGAGSDLRLVDRQTGRVVHKDPDLPFSWSNLDFVEDSVGVVYSHVTELIGFGEYEEGKTMGLAAYGRADSVPELREIVRTDKAGQVRFGVAERAALDDAFARRSVAARTDADLFSLRADTAAAVQALLEDVVLQHGFLIHERTGVDRLCVSGGVFMNCPANYRLIKEGPFKDVFVHGASGDNGTSIGAALYAYHTASQGARRSSASDPVIYTGRRYDEDAQRRALEACADLTFERCADIAAATATELAAGSVVAWFQGGSEFGARALGNRSIVADPRDPEVKDRLNRVIKGRELFRPFAPAVLFERQGELYDVEMFSPYMCVNAMATQDPQLLPAVTHVDGSARIQSVSKDANPLFHDLISRFADITGIPVVLNTSFNEREPIVETPEDAIDCFLRTEIDRLVIGPFMVRRA